MTVPISLSRLLLLLRRLRVPQVDVQTLDLFDQQENRLSGRAKLEIAVGKKTRAQERSCSILLSSRRSLRGPPESRAVYDGLIKGDT
ncbi:MAG: hypothetical protein M3P18_01310 [Actinomycetota bacterium]|nr:hypothetical protein [Actinomycetota bacterium]